MRQFKRSSITSSIIILLATTLAGPARSQSGRGRPRVPQPSPTTAQPQPINVPASAAVIKQEQAGTTSRFVLRNGMTVVISEQHATPIMAAVACFKTGALEDSGLMNGASQLLQRMILKGTTQRPGDRAVADLRALGASIEPGTWSGVAGYSVVAASDKVKAALTIQADMLQNPSLDAELIRQEISLMIGETKSAAPPREVSPSFSSSELTTGTLIANADDQAFMRSTSRDDPAPYSMSRLVGLAFSAGAPANMDALHSMTRERLVEYYRRIYRPDNMIISIAGDLSTFNTLVDIQQLYGGFGLNTAQAADQNLQVAEAAKAKPRHSSAQPRAHSSVTLPDKQQQPAKPDAANPDKSLTEKPGPSAEQDRLRYTSDRGDISQSVVSVGFHVPGADAKDRTAIEVLTALAGLGRASRLSRSLIDGQMVANRIETSYLGVAKAGLLAAQMWMAKDSREGFSIDKAESALFKELDRLRREVPAEGEMARAKTLLEKRFVDVIGNYRDRALVLALAEADGPGFRAALDYRTRVRAVTASDVQRAAAKYLTLANTSIYEYEPLSSASRTFDADTFSVTVKAWSPGFAGPVESGTVVPADPNSSPVLPQGTDRSPDRQAMLESVQALPIRDFSTLNGPKAFVREDHSQQSVTVAILFQGGRVVEDATTSGITELMLRSILYGTPRRTSLQMHDELEQLGAGVRIVVEPDFFGLVLSALSRNADRALKLLRDSIEEPAFRNDDIARARLGQIASIRVARDSSFARSAELLLQAIYPGHPYSLPPHGREEVVATLTSEKLRDWHARAIERQLPLAIIVGDTDGSALVSSQIAEGFRRRDVDTTIQVRTPQAATAAEKIEQSRREQTVLALGFPGPKAGSADLAAVGLIEAAMNGEGGRLLGELRDKQHLVSTAAVGDKAMFVAGVIVTQSATSSENEQRGRAALLAEFERLAGGGLTADELASARALETTLRTELLQSQTQRVLWYARAILYRHQASEVDSFAEQASKLTTEDIKRVASTYFKVSVASSSRVRGTPQTPAPPPPKQN